MKFFDVRSYHVYNVFFNIPRTGNIDFFKRKQRYKVEQGFQIIVDSFLTDKVSQKALFVNKLDNALTVNDLNKGLLFFRWLLYGMSITGDGRRFLGGAIPFVNGGNDHCNRNIIFRRRNSN